MDATHTGSVLRGECCDDTRPIAVQCCECLQIRLSQAQGSVNRSKILGECRVDLDSSTSRWVTSRDSQHSRQGHDTVKIAMNTPITLRFPNGETHDNLVVGGSSHDCSSYVTSELKVAMIF